MHVHCSNLMCQAGVDLASTVNSLSSDVVAVAQSVIQFPHKIWEKLENSGITTGIL